MTFSRLTDDDAPQAASFLNEVWGAHYGAVGAPIYTPDYLRWLYGGPDRDRHVVAAYHRDGRLVGLRAMLERRVVAQGKEWTACLSTHLAVHPGLPSSERAEVRNPLLEFPPLLAEESASPVSDARHVLVAYFEETKPLLLKRMVDRAVEHGIIMSCSTFNQAVVSPAILQARARESAHPGRRVRPVDDADIGELTQLFDRVAKRQPFAFTMSADQLRHHILGLPRGRSYLVEEHGVAAAFIACYPMEVLRPSGPSPVVVVELLISEGTREAACLLLNEALALARASSARGVVIENPTYLDADTRRFCGIAPSTRRMVVTTRSRIRAFECGAGFLCDVK